MESTVALWHAPLTRPVFHCVVLNGLADLHQSAPLLPMPSSSIMASHIISSLACRTCCATYALAAGGVCIAYCKQIGCVRLVYSPNFMQSITSAWYNPSQLQLLQYSTKLLKLSRPVHRLMRWTSTHALDRPLA
jgi:hypothetical protein